MGVALGPTDGDREFFRMHVVNARVTKSLHSPIRGSVGRRRAGDAAADGVSEVAEVFFERRGTEGGLNHGGCQFSTGFLDRAGAGALRNLLRERSGFDRRDLGGSGE